MKCVRLVLQHREGIYWCPAPLRDEDQRSYKVRNVADVQAAPAPPIDQYVSDSTVGSDNEAPNTANSGEDSLLPGCDPSCGGEEEEREADQVCGVGGHHHN
jgi:hypothetical protein